MTLDEARKINSGIRILSNMQRQAERLRGTVEAAVRAEREACAKLCDEIARREWDCQTIPPGQSDAGNAVERAAEAIRARTEQS